jgi:CHAT domain-containing protein/tetratricopeptide (TPR) repeat protein
MLCVKHRCIWEMILAISLLAPGFVQADSRPQTADSRQSEVPALRAVIEKYFIAYGKKDLASVLALWSEKSPGLAKYKQSLQQQFTASELSVGSPAVSRVKLEDDRARVRVTIAVTSTNQKNQQKREESRNFEMVKEGGEWKVWRNDSATDDLAASLVKADNETERAKLLQDEKELVTGELVQALIRQGPPFVFQGDYAQALTIYGFARAIAEQIGDNVKVASALNAAGGVYALQGNIAEALDNLQTGLMLSEKAGDNVEIANALVNIADVERSQGDYIQSLEHYQKSLALLESAGKKAWIVGTLLGIGHVHRLQGSYVQALEYFEKALTLSEAAGDKRSVAHTLSDIGLVHCAQGNYDLALESYQKNLKQLAGSGHNPGNIITLQNIGFVYHLQGNYDLALENYQKSLALSEAIEEKEATVTVLNNIADLHRLKGNYPLALQFAQRAAALARQVGSREDLWEALTTAGRVNLALNQLGQAHQALKEAVDTIEALRSQVAGGEQEQQLFFESKVSSYQAMVELLIRRNSPGEALTYAERAKARVLLDVISKGHVSVTKAMTVQELEQERGLVGHLTSLNSRIYAEKLRPQTEQARLAELEAQLEKARVDFEAFQTSLYTAHPELQTHRGEAPPLKIAEAEALLPDARTALAEFVVADDKTYLFVLTRSVTVEVKVYPVEIKQKDLTERIERFRQLLSTLDNRFSKSSHALYDLLLKPAAGQLQGKTRLTIVPDGSLWELPFQALQTSQGRYLIEDHAISYAPSLTVLREMLNARIKKTKPFGAATLLAFGNPTLGKQAVARVKAVLMDESLDPLPEAERQVQSLGQIYGPGQSKVYVGAAAREERFKSEAKDFRVLHLATHGIMNDRSPMYSHLLLAQNGDESKEDGMLEAWELMKLDLKADLAVLSACETARGRVGTGEGMIGLTWALFVAGVPTTVVSQWKVRSDSTAELMVEFHRQLNRRQDGPSARTSVAEALRAAALKLKGNNKYRHPFHWAAFVAIGDAY